MIDQELKEIKERLQKTSGSEWMPYIEGRDFTSGSSFIMVRDGEVRGTDIELIGATEADIDFIAHAKKDVARLIDEIVELRRAKGA